MWKMSFLMLYDPIGTYIQQLMFPKYAILFRISKLIAVICNF